MNGTDVGCSCAYRTFFMIRNYFTTAIRNLLHGKGSAFINIFGLTLGISSSLVLFLMVTHLISFDTFHSKKDRIYRVVNQSNGNQGKDYQAGVPSVLPDAFRTDFPEAEEVVFTSYRSGSMVIVPQTSGETKKYFEEAGIVYTEPGFFKIFDRAVLVGDAAKGLDDPNEAIISKSLAKKYFDKEDAIGEVLKFGENEFKVTAIMEDAPPNTDFPFELMLSYVTIKKKNEEAGWHSIWSDEQCYFLLKEGQDVKKLEARMPEFTNKYRGDGDDNPNKSEFLLQALSDLHFDSRFDTYSYKTIPMGVLISLGSIAIVLILTACINFINLATAEAIKRSKEVGVRKSLGSTRGQLVGQFLGETTFITLIALLLSLGVTQLGLGLLNPFLELRLSMDFVHNTSLWIYIISVLVIVSGLAGLYPAVVISGFKPALALKNQISSRGSSGFMMRRSLVVLQFFISQVFIICTIVIINQTNYFTSKSLGFTKDAILVTSIPVEEVPGYESKMPSKMRTLRDGLINFPGVEAVSLSGTPPSSGNVSSTSFTVDGSTTSYRTQVKQIDGAYLGLYQVELIAGKNIQDLDTATGFLVNEKLVSVAGFTNPEDIIGKHLRFWGKNLPVVGVVKDFHTVSLRNAIEPTVLLNQIRGYESLALKVNMKRSKEVIEHLKGTWEQAYPEHIFSYEFLDESIRKFYDGEKKMSALVTIFTSMAIFIGCLGLFGLASFMANQRTKEIGVRKVLGASVESIVFMFWKEFLKLIVVGFVLAAPVAGWMMTEYLSSFAYRIELGPFIFITALFSALIIAMATVSYKSITAAVRNPVKSLRYE